MTSPIIIHGSKHAILRDKSGNIHDILGKYREWLKEQKSHTKILGLYEKDGGYAPGNSIGMVWIGEGENIFIALMPYIFRKSVV